MARLLVVHHTPSPAMHAMLVEAVAGANDPAIEGVTVVVRPALSATATDVLEADGYLLGTPPISATSRVRSSTFLTRSTTPVSTRRKGGLFGAFLRGDNDATGALKAIEVITTGFAVEAGPAIRSRNRRG